ncbi:MAG: hypothetical protein N3A59_09395, partial [Thermodesulfovibrionales bacterium]|nr:hypothetical protein [Thermodesulfovibrionales bacterium]
NNESFNIKLTSEEIEIISELMLLTWIKRQIANVDIIRMKYSTDDFSLTSQANHLKALMSLQQQFEDNVDKLQKIYIRRDLQDDGMYAPTMPVFGGANYEK